MTDSVGVLAVRIWCSDQGEPRARITGKLDVADSSPAEISYCTTVVEIDAALSAWVHRFGANCRHV
jgi:hypothetical protein